MDEMNRKYHEVADIFPMMSGDEYDALKADIAQNGQREPIWLHPDGRIVDGRNRHRACVDLSIAPHFRTWDGNGSLVGFVLSLNLHRRHLTSSQCAAAAVDALPLLEEEAKERYAATVGRPSKSSQLIDSISDSNDGKAAAQAAAMFNTNRQYVADMKQVSQKAPDLFVSVRNGEKTVTQVKRELKERQREERRQVNAEAIQQSPVIERISGKFATILIDPPWDWGDEGDVDQFGRARPTYQTLTIDKLLALPVATLADVDCHLYLWITNRSLPKGFQLIEQWGFRYITCITWVKPSFGMGNYFRGQTEHMLFAVRGSQPLKRRNAPTVLMADRGPNGHSSKPTEAYQFIESCSPGPYLEMFARIKRDGWLAWGEVSNGVA